MFVCKTAWRWNWAQIWDCDLRFKDLCGQTQDLPEVTNQTEVYCLTASSLSHTHTQRYWNNRCWILASSSAGANFSSGKISWMCPGSRLTSYFTSWALLPRVLGVARRTTFSYCTAWEEGREIFILLLSSSSSPLPLSCRKIAEGTSDIREKIRLFKQDNRTSVTGCSLGTSETRIWRVFMLITPHISQHGLL